MVFVGPKSREDMGFRHSYDVLVDSYQSDEELVDLKNWKMAGRVSNVTSPSPCGLTVF
jgi:hypothetical protein